MEHFRVGSRHTTHCAQNTVMLGTQGASLVKVVEPFRGS